MLHFYLFFQYTIENWGGTIDVTLNTLKVIENHFARIISNKPRQESALPIFSHLKFYHHNIYFHYNMIPQPIFRRINNKQIYSEISPLNFKPLNISNNPTNNIFKFGFQGAQKHTCNVRYKVCLNWSSG